MTGVLSVPKNMAERPMWGSHLLTRSSPRGFTPTTSPTLDTSVIHFPAQLRSSYNTRPDDGRPHSPENPRFNNHELYLAAHHDASTIGMPSRPSNIASELTHVRPLPRNSPSGAPNPRAEAPPAPRRASQTPAPQPTPPPRRRRSSSCPRVQGRGTRMTLRVRRPLRQSQISRAC